MSNYEESSFLGGGEAYIGIYDVNMNLQGEFDIGNVKSFTIEAPSIEKKKSISKRRDTYGQLNASVVISVETRFTVIIDDINRKNMSLALFGTDTDISQAANTVTGEEFKGYQGAYTKLDNRKLKTTPAISVYSATNPAVIFTESTDYEVDTQSGRIYVVESGTIIDGQSLKTDYSYNDLTGFNVAANTVTSRTAMIRLQYANKNTGTAGVADGEVIIWKTSIEPSSAFDWLSDEFAELTISGEILTYNDKTWEMVEY